MYSRNIFSVLLSHTCSIKEKGEGEGEGEGGRGGGGKEGEEEGEGEGRGERGEGGGGGKFGELVVQTSFKLFTELLKVKRHIRKQLLIFCKTLPSSPPPSLTVSSPPWLCDPLLPPRT